MTGLTFPVLMKAALLATADEFPSPLPVLVACGPNLCFQAAGLALLALLGVFHCPVVFTRHASLSPFVAALFLLCQLHSGFSLLVRFFFFCSGRFTRLCRCLSDCSFDGDASFDFAVACLGFAQDALISLFVACLVFCSGRFIRLFRCLFGFLLGAFHSAISFSEACTAHILEAGPQVPLKMPTVAGFWIWATNSGSRANGCMDG